MTNTQNTPNYFAIIPATIRYDSDLNSLAKLLYGEITALCNKEGFCWATNRYFSNLYECSNRTIIRALNLLKEKKYIFILLDNESGENVQRKIYITNILSQGHDKSVTGGYDKSVTGGYDKSVTYNNTSINNTSINNKTCDKKPYGEFENVYLSDSEFKKLKNRFYNVEEEIEKASAYIKAHNKKYKDHYAVMLNWLKAAKLEKKETMQRDQLDYSKKMYERYGANWKEVIGFVE